MIQTLRMAPATGPMWPTLAITGKFTEGNFFLNTYRVQIIAKYGQQQYDAVKANLLANETKVLEMVRGVGQAIAAPGASMHQRGKAIDIGGPSAIDNKQVEVVKLVARAHSDLLSGKVLKERNGCVHFEIR